MPLGEAKSEKMQMPCGAISSQIFVLNSKQVDFQIRTKLKSEININDLWASGELPITSELD